MRRYNSRLPRKGGRIYVRGGTCQCGRKYDIFLKSGLGRCSRCKHNNWLKYQYGITIDDYEKLLVAQGGGCAVCGAKRGGPKKRWLCLDHDHKTGTVRGLLCCKCNRGIECFDDDPALATRAGAYLERTAEIRLVPGGRGLV